VCPPNAGAAQPVRRKYPGRQGLVESTAPQARARWVGRVIAPGVDEAIEAAVVEFKADVRKLIAVRRLGIA